MCYHLNCLFEPIDRFNMELGRVAGCTRGADEVKIAGLNKAGLCTIECIVLDDVLLSEKEYNTDFLFFVDEEAKSIY